MATTTLENIPVEVAEKLARLAREKGRTVAEEIAVLIDGGDAPLLGAPILTDEMSAPYDLMAGVRGEQVPVIDGGELRLEFWFRPLEDGQ